MALSSSGTDNVIAALGQSNRIYRVDLHLVAWKLENILAAMHILFPKLTYLQLWSRDETLVIPNSSFLDGSAPRLRILTLNSIPFPELPKLLQSATQLVHLNHSAIPHSVFISPKAMVSPLSVLSNLETFHLEFISPQSSPGLESQHLLPPARSILPALVKFHFKGVTKYLEELVTRIDTPQLVEMNITYFNQIDFDCPRLVRFINCTSTLRARDEAHVQFDDSAASVLLRSSTSNGDLLIKISCRVPDWQFSSIGQVCDSSLHPLSMVEDLRIKHRFSELV